LVNIPAWWNTNEVKLKCQDFVINQVQEHMGRTLVFLNKMPANLHVCIKQGQAPQGHLAQLTMLPTQNLDMSSQNSAMGMWYCQVFCMGPSENLGMSITLVEKRR
jgi:hypothetical protein